MIFFKRAVVDYLTNTENLSKIAKNIGIKDLVFTEVIELKF